MKFTVHIDGEGIKLDDKIDCRVCLASIIFMGEFKETPRVGAKDMTPKFYPVKMNFKAFYMPSLNLYLAMWGLEEDDFHQHRSIVMPWQGGLPVQFQISAHLEDALKQGAQRILSGQYHGGDYTNDRTVFVPYEGLLEVFQEEGGVVLSNATPSPMQAAPAEPAAPVEAQTPSNVQS
jgi:hypothetical protein